MKMTQRKKKKFPFRKSQIQQLLLWASEKSYFSLLNGNGHSTIYGAFRNTLFVGRRNYIESNRDSFEKLEQMLRQKNDWLYGYFGYELKNEIEALESDNPATIPVQHLAFYVPEIIIEIEDDYIIIYSFENPDTIYKEISTSKGYIEQSVQRIESIKCATTRRQYIENVNYIREQIVEGEFYELNYCIEFSTKAISFNPLSCYTNLNKISPMPFSSFMRVDDKYLICASPERFLKKKGNRIVSQPIKGTIRRSFDKSEDQKLKENLANSEKEKAENLMIVDLVRNDLAKSAKTGTVKVDELFGIYTFKKVHQMISTISAVHDEKVALADVIKNAFPMGSMTGAPKIRVMEEIEKLENSSRGLYSGAVGHFSPDGAFDFNVVIRSIIYDSKTKMISFHVGSAITFDSDPEYEYNECLLKADALLEVLKG